MQSKFKIPSLLGVFILVIGLAVGVALIGQRQIFRLGASADSAPQDVRVSNVTDSSFTVSWFTTKPTIGYVNWGATTALGKSSEIGGLSTQTVHSVTIDGLEPSTNYYLVINSGGVEFDNNGIAWSVATGPALGASSETRLASGVVLKQDGSPASNVLVYINGGGMAQMSAVTSLNGTWTIPLSSARTRTLSGNAQLANSDVLDVYVQSGGMGIATAQVLPTKINPTPEITLGQTYDFRDSSSSQSGALPKADVSLPEEQEAQLPGSLDISSDGATQTTERPVTIESIDEAEEIIYTDTPEFFGEGPRNTTITITVESDPITENVKVSSSGDWSWSPPTNLENGEHTITISWIDASGFIRKLTRTFTVAAAENEPGFVSTPSGATATAKPTASPTASPTPSPTPKATKTPTPTPTPTPTIKATPTPSNSPTPTRVSIPSTESGIPVAGVSTPTLLLALVGLLLFVSGIFISRKSANS